VYMSSKCRQISQESQISAFKQKQKFNRPGLARQVSPDPQMLWLLSKFCWTPQ
jgi:hypothetical protein